VEAFTVEPGGVSLFVRDWGEPDRPALLYWDGLGGCGLHANEIAPILTEAHGLRVVAPDAPGHGRSPALPPEWYRPSTLAGVAADLLSELGISRAIFMGFSWGGRIACSFGASFPERSAGLALIDGGYVEWADISSTDTAADLNTCIAAASRGAEKDSFATWDEYFAVQREELGRWTPALAEAHRSTMREAGGRIVPILEPEVGGAIRHGEYQVPLTSTYPPLADAEVPVLLLTAPEETKYLREAEAAIARFRAALPKARVESRPDAIHDLVSYDPTGVAELVGRFARAQPPP
jgi:pimeloyl-ACP methyl ester carboxylesterase